ncbi:ATP-binding protein [Hydrogenovibrio sp. SC-1]|uniref:ATP-binding protein n=1 Tax=Hydrogenovibrio sp. SC-1 TaxID=2065820 RepID=UPI001E647563|nr:ATP-binding protein [Hydrogenovibrio sp. SC-1]
MSLKFKLIMVLMAFGVTMLVATLLSGQYLLNHTMVKYIDRADEYRLDRLKNNLEVYMDEVGLFDTEWVSEDVWQRLLTVSYRIDLTHTYIPMNILLKREYPQLLRFHPDEFETRVSLLNRDGKVIRGDGLGSNEMMSEIVVDGDIAGWVAYPHHQSLTEQADIEFTEQQSTFFTWGAVLLTFVIVVLLLIFVNHFMKPIRQLTQGMRQLSQGKFSTRLSIYRQDEFGQLQKDFNHLAACLEKSRHSRNQWIADISHELRTPLTILHGSLEAIEDGIRPASIENLHKIHEEVMLLSRLVEDFYQVALNDIGGLSYKMQILDFQQLVSKSVASIEGVAQEKGLLLCYDVKEGDYRINGDEARLGQMITNLLINSLSYTDAYTHADEAGRIEVLLYNQSGNVVLEINDSEPGVAEDELSQLFERLYRTEMSRNRRHGGAGLGLSIVRQIVEAHSGKITAHSSRLGGLSLVIELPL